jgi:hypothetical protein
MTLYHNSCEKAARVTDLRLKYGNKNAIDADWPLFMNLGMNVMSLEIS